MKQSIDTYLMKLPIYTICHNWSARFALQLMEGERYCEGSNPRDKDMVKSDVLENVATTSPIMILPLALCIKFSITY